MEPSCTKVYENKRGTKSVSSKWTQSMSRIGQGQIDSKYVQPQKQVKGLIWIKAIPLVIHAIEKRTKTIIELFDASSFYSNTSLRRTSKTRLVEAEIPQEVITKRTGRISEIAKAVSIEELVYQRKMSMALYGCETAKTGYKNRNEMNEKNLCCLTLNSGV